MLLLFSSPNNFPLKEMAKLRYLCSSTSLPSHAQRAINCCHQLKVYNAGMPPSLPAVPGPSVLVSRNAAAFHLPPSRPDTQRRAVSHTSASASKSICANHNAIILNPSSSGICSPHTRRKSRGQLLGINTNDCGRSSQEQLCQRGHLPH